MKPETQMALNVLLRKAQWKASMSIPTTRNRCVFWSLVEGQHST